MDKLNKYIDKVLIMLGSAIVAYGIYNIHSKCNIAEGGELGIELLIYNLLNISPAIVALLIDVSSYIIGSILFGKKFLLNAIIGTLAYSFFYFIFESMPSTFPDLSNNLLLASVVGGIFVGIGCGIVINKGGACGGDDAIALIIAKKLKIHVSMAYFLLDVFIIIISLSYIDFNKIMYSLLTAMISSVFIGYMSKMTRIDK
ncbi:MAG: YitT family protein [Clostridia bacterium]|nr:YitT family protein [Clostridia bacterium]